MRASLLSFVVVPLICGLEVLGTIAIRAEADSAEHMPSSPIRRSPSADDSISQTDQSAYDRIPITFSAETSLVQSPEDSTLDMRPSEIEPIATEEQAAARFRSYRTEPTFRVPFVLVEYLTKDHSQLAPGYYFTAPYGCGTFGPLIFDQDGNLVYWGINQAGGRVKNFSPCSGPNGQQNHLCWSETFYDEWHHSSVRNRIFDSTYTQVGRDWGAIGGSVYPNSHEFNMLPGGKSFLQVVYEFRDIDLSAYNGPVEGWLYDGCFQEVDIESADVLFSWCATNHFPLHETYMYLDIPGQQNFSEAIAGTGTFERPWDFIHINSVDKTPSGDYVVSSRHFNSIFKVEGIGKAQPGMVTWSLGGKSNSFDADFTFSRQHHARYLYSDGQTTVLSILNNGFSVRNPAALEGLSSNGQVIKLEEGSWTATLLRNYTHPHHERGWRESVTIAEGSMDFQQANNGVVVGWGSLPDVSEFAEDGTLLFHASIADHTGRSYRAWKKPWTGRPHWPPVVLAYSQTCGSHAGDSNVPPLITHVSWNGATEVLNWRFYVSTASKNGPWIRAGMVAKQGFETKADLRESFAPHAFQYARHVKVEALDRWGMVLGNAIATIFVPLPDLDCDLEGCAESNFTYSAELSIASSCPLSPRSVVPTIGSVLLILVCFAGGIWLSKLLLKWALSLRSCGTGTSSAMETQRLMSLDGRDAGKDSGRPQTRWMRDDLGAKF